MASIKDPEELVPCPFDRTHMIRVKKIQGHIDKCIKNHPNHNMKRCPFNATHWVDKSTIDHHIQNCVDKKAIELEAAYQAGRTNSEGTYSGGKVTVPSYETNNVFNSTENWDDQDEGHFSIVAEPIVEAPKHPTTSGRFDGMDVRKPRQPPRVLQNQFSQSDKGYGRGFLMEQTKQEEQLQMLSRLGRGRGQLNSQSESGTVKTLGQVLNKTGNNSNITDHAYPDSNFDDADVSQEPSLPQNKLSQPRDIRSSLESMSVSSSQSDRSDDTPAFAKKQGGNSAVPRSINIGSRFSPNTSREASPLRAGKPTVNGGRPGSPGQGLTALKGRGRGIYNFPSEQSSAASQMRRAPGIGRGMIKQSLANAIGGRATTSTGTNSPCSVTTSDEIETLEKQRMNGQKLSSSELQKVLQKSELNAKLQNLRFH